jgi:hypothetical protein
LTGALPPLEPGAIPAGVNDPQRFRAALGFERVLLGELLSNALPEQGEGPQAATFSDNLADALVARGGIGIAAEIERGMK